MIERYRQLLTRLLNTKTGLLVGLGSLCLAGAALLFVEPLFVIVGILAVLVGIAVLKQPYYGVLLYIVLLYVRPGDMFPPLEPLRLTMLGVALLTGAYLLQVLVYRRVSPIFSPPLAMMGLFLLTIVLSMIDSYNKGVTMTRFLDILRIVFMSYLIVHVIDTMPRLKGFMATLVLAMAGLSTAIVIRYFLFPETHIEGKGGSGGIAGGFLGDGNDYALAQTVVLPWAFVLAGSIRHWLLKPLLIFAIAIGLMAIAVTYSRGGFLGLAVVLVCMYALWVLRTRKYAFGLITGLIGFSLIIITVLALAPDDFIDRMGTIKDYEQDESAMGRIDAWRASRAMFADHTFLGVGAGAFSDAYGRQYMPRDAVSNVWREAHSAFFQTLGELGLFGILTLYGLWISIAYTALRLHRTVLADPEEDRFFHAMRGAILVSLLGWFTCSLFLSVTYYPHLFVQAVAVTSLKYFAETKSLAPKIAEEIEMIEEEDV